MLKSFARWNKGQWPLILSENSTNQETQALLRENDVPYHVYSPGIAHQDSLDRAIRDCGTEFALIVDTDVIFQGSIEEDVSLLVSAGPQTVMLGEFDPGRVAGRSCVSRIHPWYCLLRTEFFCRFGASFEPSPKAEQRPGSQNAHYDVGSVVLETARRQGFKAIFTKPEDRKYQHIEGMSWVDVWDRLTGDSNNHRRVQLREYKERFHDALGEINLRERFCDGRSPGNRTSMRPTMSEPKAFASQLDEIFERNGTDKGSICHHYHTVYEQVLSPTYRSSVKYVLEIGIDKGNSLRAWREWFPNATIVGADFIQSKLIQDHRIESFCADQGDPATLTFWSLARGIQFDVIVDDGSHQPHHQALSLFRLWPWLKPGGHYFIEDCLDPAYIPCFECMQLTFHDLRKVGLRESVYSMLWHGRKKEV